MNKKFLARILMVVLSFGLLIPEQPISAHTAWVQLVPRLPASAEEPGPEGTCGVDEYRYGLSRSLQYRPRFDADPAIFQYVTSPTRLFVCISGLPHQAGLAMTTVALIFDTAHDGGTSVDDDDLSFSINELGERAAYRGAGAAGFVAAPDVTDWMAASGPPNQPTWSAEFSLPLSLLGGGREGTSVGFQLRNQSLSGLGDDYAWPPAAAATVPNTWADLPWLYPAAGMNADAVRISQGLEYDVTGRVTYNLVAGKDTLIRAQVYSPTAPREVASATCRIQQPGGGERTVPVSFSPEPRLSDRQADFFDGSPVFNCWVPGDYLAAAGYYRFELELRRQGRPDAERLLLGSRLFQPSADLRVLVVGLDARGAISNTRGWGGDVFGAIPATLREINRMTPLRTGIGAFDWQGAAQPAGGLRYFVSPVILTCMLAEGGTACDNRARALALDARRTNNALLELHDLITGLHSDRFDRALMLTAFDDGSGGGGQARGAAGANCSVGAAIEAAYGWNAFVIGQELLHCLGQVQPGSPHSDGGTHTTTCAWGQDAQYASCLDRTQTYPGPIPLFRGTPMVNLLTRMDVSRPASSLAPVNSPGIDPATLMEGWEWNNLRGTMLQLNRPAVGRLAVAQAMVDAPIFTIIASLDKADEFIPYYSERLDSLPVELTEPSPDSPYALLFFDAQDAELSRLPFAVSFETTHPHQPSTAASAPAVMTDLTNVLLSAPLPAGSARVEVRHGAAVLYSQVFSGQAPSVSAVTATPGGKNILLQWTATDPDSDTNTLTYNLFWRAEPDAVPLLIAHGLHSPSFPLPTEFLPATDNGVVTVEASDGYNTAAAQSPLITVAAHPPAVAITTPSAGASLVAGQPIVLLGSAYDYTFGSIPGEAFNWSSDKDGPLGSGEKRVVVLTAGQHELTLEAGTSGLTASTSVPVDVLADADGDGLPDTYEEQKACLSPAQDDSAADPDGDALTSLGEWQRGTEPCTADSDGDGVGDGDEVRQGGDPTSAERLPLPDLAFLGSDEADLGMCPSPTERTLAVQTTTPQVEWGAYASVDWLEVEGAAMGNGPFKLTAHCAGLSAGKHAGLVVIGVAGGQTLTLDVTLTVPGPLYLPLVLR